MQSESLLLQAYATGKTKEWLLAHPEFKPTLLQKIKLRWALAQRKRGVPFAYLTKHKEFFGLDFYVDKRVLVPRPETEILVEAVLQTINNLNQKGFSPSDLNITLIDVGTGSGCIPIAILSAINGPASGGKNYPDVSLTVFASDISQPAIQVARRNAAQHQTAIDFFTGNLLEPIIKKLPFPLPLNVLITANLPYGWSEWKNNSSAQTIGLKFEPPQALFTTENGLKEIRILLEQIAALSETNPHTNFSIFLEFDPRQTKLLTALIHKIFPQAALEIKRDLAGHGRVAVVTF